MSDLSGKFASFEEQSATQHTELMNALNSIAYALGAPPTTPTITLADVVTAINTLSDTLSAMYTADGNYYVSSLNTLDLINISLDTTLNNNSLNAQRIIAAIYATFCECNTDIPLLGPPLDVTPTTVVDEAKCRRIQFYLSVFGNWLNKIANYGASGAAITGGTLQALLLAAAADAGILATGVEVGAAAGPPGIVIGAVIALLTIGVYTFGGSYLIDYANQFNDPTLRDNMVQAMYAATNADEGYTAFKTTLLATIGGAAGEVIYTLWWSAWSNDIYSGTPEVDDSAFDGSICAPAETNCATVESDSLYGSQYANFSGAAELTAYLDAVSGDPHALNANYAYTVEWVSGAIDAAVTLFDNAGNWHSETTVPTQSEVINGRMYIRTGGTVGGGSSFVVKVCIVPV